MTSKRWLAVVFLFFSLGSPLAADQTIEVTSQGAVEVMPDVIWIEGQLVGSGDMKEAEKILQGLQDDIRKALADPQFASIKTQYSKRSISAGGATAADIQRQMMEMMGEGPPAAESEGVFTIVEDFRLVNGGLTEENFSAEVERMLALATALSDKQIKLTKIANNVFNPYAEGQNVGRFMRVGLSDPEQVWKTASQAAFQNARSRAETLAEIAGGNLGPALSISVDSEQEVMSDSASEGLRELIIAQYGGASSATKTGLAQHHLDKIPVKVTLRVRFAYLPAK
jgi:hypothetical protein